MNQSHPLRGLIAPSVPAACISNQYVVGNSRIINNGWIVQPPSCVRPPRPQQIWYQTNAASQYCRSAPPPLIFHPHHSQQVQRLPVTPVQPTPAVMPSAFTNRATLQYFPTPNSQVSSYVQCNCACCQFKSCCCQHHSYSHSIVPYHRTTYHCNDNICYSQQHTIFQSCTRQTRCVNHNASNTSSDHEPCCIVQENRQVQAPIDDLHARPEVLTPTDSDPNGTEEIDGMESQPEKKPRVEASPPYSPQSLIIDLDPDLHNDILNDKLPFEDFVDDRNSNNNNNNSNLVTKYGIIDLVSDAEDSVDSLSTEVELPEKDNSFVVGEAAMNCTREQDDDKIFNNDTDQQRVICSESSELNELVAEEISKSSESESQEPVQSDDECKTVSVEEVIEFGISEVSVYEIPSPKNDTIEVEKLQCTNDELLIDDCITLTREVSSLISLLAASIVSFPPVNDFINSPPDSSDESSNPLPLDSFDGSSNPLPLDSIDGCSNPSPPDSIDGCSNPSPPHSFDGSSNPLPPDSFDGSSNPSPPDSFDGSSNPLPPDSFDGSSNPLPLDSFDGSSNPSPPDSIDGSSNPLPPDSFDGSSNPSSPALMDDPSYSDTDEFYDLSLSLDDDDDSSISSPPALMDDSSNSSPHPMDKPSSPLVISIPLSVLDCDTPSDPSVCAEPSSPLIVSYPISVWLGRHQKKQNGINNSSIDDSKSRLNKILDSSTLLSAIDLYIIKGFFLNMLPKMEKEVLRYALIHSPATATSKAFYIGIELNLTTKEWVSFKHYGVSLDTFDNSIHA